MNKRTLYEEYLVCKKRGHVPSTPPTFRTASIPPVEICKYCKCYFWEETINKESNVPESGE